MTHTQASSHTTSKKHWTAPVIQAITLNSAKNGTAQNGDGPGGGKS